MRKNGQEMEVSSAIHWVPVFTDKGTDSKESVLTTGLIHFLFENIFKIPLILASINLQTDIVAPKKPPFCWSYNFISDVESMARQLLAPIPTSLNLRNDDDVRSDETISFLMISPTKTENPRECAAL